jgi:predicted CXXCH cytochrome family protein
MKKSVLAVLCILMGMLFVASMAMAAAGDGITGTKHDLSLTGTAGNNAAFGTDGENRICIYCHAPHNTLKPSDAAAQGLLYVPLWNHEVTVQTYKMYSAGTELPNDVNHQSQAMIALLGGDQPGGVSRLCLSCHDGSVATNSYGFAPGVVNAGVKKITSANVSLIGGDLGDGGGYDLSNHHPIGFDYADAKSHDNELAETSVQLGANADVTIGSLLWNGKMECTTCHDVHNTKNTGEKFLWKSDGGSALCGTCHLKL